MWIFAYGSLMGDGWEKPFHCTRRELGVLDGHRRSFTKASTRNWGSKAQPCPTLRILRDPFETCAGIAFRFDGNADRALAYLSAREGKNFDLTEVDVVLGDASTISAKTFVYSGPNLITIDDATGLAKLLILAIGTDGTGLDYLRNVRRELAATGVSDQAVEQLAQAVTDEGGWLT